EAQPVSRPPDDRFPTLTERDADGARRPYGSVMHVGRLPPRPHVGALKLGMIAPRETPVSGRLVTFRPLAATSTPRRSGRGSGASPPLFADLSDASQARLLASFATDDRPPCRPRDIEPRAGGPASRPARRSTSPGRVPVGQRPQLLRSPDRGLQRPVDRRTH